MSKEWEVAVEALSQVMILANPENEPVTIKGSSDNLRCIGVGTDAAVFQHIEAPRYAFKVYADEKLTKKELEKTVYQRLGEASFFSKFYDTGDRYLVLSFERGTTLYDCILQGIHIPKQVIQDVEDARTYIRDQNLNPRDIHLKNILLQNGRAKILDVSEYMKSGNDFRWEHLRKGYDEYYHLIDGKPVPYWLVETVRKWYNQARKQTFAFEEFMQTITRLLLFWKDK